SGGFNDPQHPFPQTLDLLKSLRQQHDFTYARTDRNGLITVEPAQQQISAERNRLNDFTPNTLRDEEPVVQVATSAAAPTAAAPGRARQERSRHERSCHERSRAGSRGGYCSAIRWCC